MRQIECANDLVEQLVNLRVIDESLSEYSTILESNPEDELSGEMFDTVLNDKMDLLRDFADL